MTGWSELRMKRRSRSRPPCTPARSPQSKPSAKAESRQDDAIEDLRNAVAAAGDDDDQLLPRKDGDRLAPVAQRGETRGAPAEHPPAVSVAHAAEDDVTAGRVLDVRHGNELPSFPPPIVQVQLAQ